MEPALFTAMLFATLVAGTPLIIAALGELVAERSGVLNLGVEGMMAVGAVTAFAVCHESGSAVAGMLAAALAGIKVERVRFATYVMCAMLAALCGYLFSGFSGGSSLSMGEQYLLASIAVVVIGGTSVAGGNGNVPGLWGAALFLFLVQSMLNTYQLSAGIRYLATGLIIIAVITAAGGQKTLR